MKTARVLLFLLVTTLTLHAQSIGDEVQYLLLGDSTFTDECQICDHVSIPRPMRGTFTLTQTAGRLGATFYSISNVVLIVGSGSDLITLTGSGTYQRSFGHPLSQYISLNLEVVDSFTNRAVQFTNQVTDDNRIFPSMDVGAQENPGTLARTYNLEIVAAPVREIWFSPGSDVKSTNGVTLHSGDIVSNYGRVVKSNASLLLPAGVNVSVGIDAFSVIAGGEIVFSPSQAMFSETFGPIGEGDLISTKGTILKRNSDLLNAFQPPAGTADAGLDAVQVLQSGEIYFSTRSNVFSTRLGVTLSHGDILSDSGDVIVAGQDLVQSFSPAPFDPKDPDPTYGLTAFYIWPSTEVWFSTSKDFVSTSLGPISHGDILSDRGYIVFRSAVLASNLGAAASGTNGLAGFFIVTDISTIPEFPSFNSVISRSSGMDLGWSGPGRVFQVERADSLPGSFSPVSELLPDTFFTAPRGADVPAGFFRLRQW